jgi:hypothetical protein
MESGAKKILAVSAAAANDRPVAVVAEQARRDCRKRGAGIDGPRLFMPGAEETARSQSPNSSFPA